MEVLFKLCALSRSSFFTMDLSTLLDYLCRSTNPFRHLTLSVRDSCTKSGSHCVLISDPMSFSEADTCLWFFTSPFSGFSLMFSLIKLSVLSHQHITRQHITHLHSTSTISPHFLHSTRREISYSITKTYSYLNCSCLELGGVARSTLAGRPTFAGSTTAVLGRLLSFGSGLVSDWSSSFSFRRTTHNSY